MTSMVPAVLCFGSTKASPPTSRSVHRSGTAKVEDHHRLRTPFTFNQSGSEWGFPCARHLHSERHSVYALRSELDQWRNSRAPILSEPASGKPVRRWWVAFGLLGAVTVVGAGLWMWPPRSGSGGGLVKAVPLTSSGITKFFPPCPRTAAKSRFPGMTSKPAAASFFRAEAATLTSGRWICQRALVMPFHMPDRRSG